VRITLDEFGAIRDIINKETGILLSDSKKYLVELRLKSRFQDLNCIDINEYMDFLKNDRTELELDRFIEALTVNKTSFFEDPQQLGAFADEVLPKMIYRKAKSGDRSIKIWSTGCSTGEEPYTLSMLLLEKVKDIESWKIQVIGNDINKRDLAVAKAGVYPERALNGVSKYYIDKYFSSSGNLYRIKPDVKKRVQFIHLNLMYKEQVCKIKDTDCIFCRNVLVYFDLNSARQALRCMYDCMAEGGFLFLGHSESLHQISAEYEMEIFKNAFAYVKKTMPSLGNDAKSINN